MKLFACALSALSVLLGAAVAPAQQDNNVAPRNGGVFVQVGTHRLYVRCVGPAGMRPTVLLESGGGGSSADWALVQAAVSSSVRTCAYDRAGLGQSERGPGPETMAQETFELHEMLAAAKIDGPFVLVGQSIGGLLVRLYAQQFGADVAGMVLVDPTHESSVVGSLRYGGMVRLREKAAGTPVPAPRLVGPVDVQEPPGVDYMAEEFAQLYRSRRDQPRPLGNKPLVVLAAGRRSAPPPGIEAGAWSALRDERDQQVRDLAGLSSNAAYEQDALSGHGIHVDNPGLVARAIQAVVEAATHGTIVTAASLVFHVPIQAQADDSHLPVSLDRIRAALNEQPPLLRVPAWSGETPTFHVEVRQPLSLVEPVKEEPFDPTYGLPSVGELLVGGIEKVHSAAVGYKRGHAERRARREVDDALAAFCAVNECPAHDTGK